MIKNTINEILIYDAVKPFEPFRYFFFIGFLVSVFAILFKNNLALYAGYVPLSIDGGGVGASRFLIDAYFPLSLFYIFFVVIGLKKEKIRLANAAVERNKFAKKPVLLAAICLSLVPYIFFVEHSLYLIDLFSLNKFPNLLFTIPMFGYTTVQSFVIVICYFLARRYGKNHQPEFNEESAER